jgi:hypothetical protein
MTNPPTDERREAFERFCKLTGYSSDRDDWGDYLYQQTRGAWDGWVASLKTCRSGISTTSIQRLAIHSFQVNGRAEKFVSVKDLTALISKAEKV